MLIFFFTQTVSILPFWCFCSFPGQLNKPPFGKFESILGFKDCGGADRWTVATFSPTGRFVPWKILKINTRGRKKKMSMEILWHYEFGRMGYDIPLLGVLDFFMYDREGWSWMKFQIANGMTRCWDHCKALNEHGGFPSNQLNQTPHRSKAWSRHRCWMFAKSCRYESWRTMPVVASGLSWQMVPAWQIFPFGRCVLALQTTQLRWFVRRPFRIYLSWKGKVMTKNMIRET